MEHRSAQVEGGIDAQLYKVQVVAREGWVRPPIILYVNYTVATHMAESYPFICSVLFCTPIYILVKFPASSMHCKSIHAACSAIQNNVLKLSFV